jgi:hypothetical protein
MTRIMREGWDADFGFPLEIPKKERDQIKVMHRESLEIAPKFQFYSPKAAEPPYRSE